MLSVHTAPVVVSELVTDLVITEQLHSVLGQQPVFFVFTAGVGRGCWSVRVIVGSVVTVGGIIKHLLGDVLLHLPDLNEIIGAQAVSENDNIGIISRQLREVLCTDTMHVNNNLFNCDSACRQQSR